MESAQEASAGVVVPIQINGSEEFTARTLDVISPNTGRICWQASVANQADAVRAVEAAHSAFPRWSAMKPAAKRDIFLKTADILEKRAKEYGEFMQVEVGANVGFSTMFNLPKCISMLRDIAARIMALVGAIPSCEEGDRSAMILQVPYGVVLGIAPWNAPYILGMRAIANAIGAGNTTVIKASEQAPRCFWALGRAFAEGGLPPGVLNILCCPPADAHAITSTIIGHTAVKKVNFTGSVRVGREIGILCGQNVKPCLMELGGKNSAIVLADANLSLAVQEAIKGSFLNNGQICMSTDRILIHRSVAEEFLAQLKVSTANAYPGDKLQSTQISSGAISRVQSLASEALSSGGRPVVGDEKINSSSKRTSGGLFLGPMIIADATKEMRIWKEEIFGMAVACMVFDSEEEAIQIANETECGLSSAVFTRDLQTGLRVAHRLETGAVHINSMTVHDETALPHGGMKSSGWGRFNATQGLQEFLQSKTITWKG